MSKRILGWLINGLLFAGVLVTGVIFPIPEVFIPVWVGALLVGTIQSCFTIVETKPEKHLGESKPFLNMSSNEDSKSNPEPVKAYEDLHSATNTATFLGNHGENYSLSDSKIINEMYEEEMGH